MDENEFGVITLNFHERMKMSRDAKCPHCKGTEFKMRRLETSKNPAFSHRVIVQCSGCSYWTEWFDGWTWYPQEMLEEENG